MTTSLGPVTTPASTPSSSTVGTTTTGLGNDLNTFLKLLTTQLQNQDPESPLDTNQMTSQLVQFSQVEQAINTNSKLDQLVTLQSANQTVTSLPLVGHMVQYSDNKAALISGQAQFGYNLPTAATNVTLTVTDANGNMVYRGPGETGAGDHTFNWNGQAADGSTLPDGVYTLDVAATAADASTITASISGFGKINQITVNNGTPTLSIGALSEPLSKIVSVTDVAAAS